MITRPFRAGEVIGEVQRANAANDSFETAIYTLKLQSCYMEFQKLLAQAFTTNEGTNEPGLNPAALMRPEVQAALTASKIMADFCEAAPRIRKLVTADQQLWKRAEFATPEEVRSMFVFWRESPELREAAAEAMKELDEPNGVAGKPDALLTDAERADPLSRPSGPNGTLSFTEKPTTVPGSA